MRGNRTCRLGLVAESPEGLSPLMRGNPERSQLASAGSTSGLSPLMRGNPPHPRLFTYDDSGLSPLMRGNPNPKSTPPKLNGSIPAHAGKPRSRPDLLRSRQVYPRSCGETYVFAGADRLLAGLSPLMRGNHAPSAA